MILETCKYFEGTGNFCSRVTAMRCDEFPECEFKYIAELKAENERLKEENYQLQKDCQICENFIDFIPCKPIRDMDYDLQKVIGQRDDYYQTLQEIKEIAEELLEKGLEPQSVEHQLRLRGKRELASIIIDLITKVESEG